MTDRDAMVQNPPHYVEGRKYEPIDVLLDWFGTDPLLWQVGKYISRAGRKGPALQDLQKAKFYLERAIRREEKTRDPLTIYEELTGAHRRTK